MDTISIASVLDLGAKNLGNHPDNLVRRTILAQLLVTSRAVKSIEAGVNAFKLWSVPQSRDHSIETILYLADQRAKPSADFLHE